MQWLSDLFSKLFRFVPILRLVDPDEGCLRITCGKRARIHGPGWYWIWPAIQRFYTLTVTPQIVDVRPQSLLTRDGRNMVVGVGIRYRVKNVESAILAVNDYEKSIQVLTLGLLAEYIGSRNYNDCRDVTVLNDYVMKRVKEEARGWGLEIQKVYVTDFGVATNIRLLTDATRII